MWVLLTVRFLRGTWLFLRLFLGYGGYLLCKRWFGPEEGTSPWLERMRARLDERGSHLLLSEILALRGVFIKMGQVLSVLGGFLPKPYTEKLRLLQDQVPAQAFARVSERFYDDFGTGPGDAFDWVNPEPVASASLGQVHEGRTKDGTRVAIKFLYPDIERIVAVDMRCLRLALHLYRRFFPVENIMSAQDALEDLLRRETDYVHEANNMKRFGACFSEVKDIVVPQVVEAWSSKHVLTMTFMEGIKVTDLDAMRAAGVDPKRVAVRFVQSFFQQLFVHRFFHTDPHPGNFLVQPGDDPSKPTLVVLDFGAVSELEGDKVEGMLDVMQSLLERKDHLFMRGVERIGFVNERGDKELLNRTMHRYFEKLISFSEHSPSAVLRTAEKERDAFVQAEFKQSELRKLMGSVRYPDNWFYVERAVALGFWLVGNIDPDVDILRSGFPTIFPLIAQRTKLKSAERSKGVAGSSTSEARVAT